MSTDLIIRKFNEVYIEIECEPAIKMELGDTFSFFAPNYKFHPKFKMRMWDGKIRLFQLGSGRIYAGLLDKIIEFADKRKYTYEVKFDNNESPVSLFEMETFLKTIELPFDVRDYQMESILDSLRRRRRVLLSPTASGKSLIIYSILRFLDVKSLLIVPTISLVYQMRDDFISYDHKNKWGVDDHVSLIKGGESKVNLNQIVISTWQSLYDLPRKWFADNKFKVVILDEAHGGKAASIIKIMEHLTDTPYRIGLTGTLDDITINELTLQGLFGGIKSVVKTNELIENQTLSSVSIKCLLLKYSKETCKATSKFLYQDEIKFITGHTKRNNFIANLALSLKGNTLVLFNLVEGHGEVLLKRIQEKNKDKSVYFISGKIDGKERERIRKEVEAKGKDCIIVASMGTFSTGVNIVRLHNIIFAHPTKAKIKILQSIGRILRRNDEKTQATVYDISDDLSHRKKKNYTYLHFVERLKVYVREKFNYKIHPIILEKD